MKTIGVIPARYASSRLPGKPLALIRGKSLIERVYRRAIRAQSLSALFVATDEKRIADHVEGFGGNVIMTSPECPSGTDRLAEAARQISTADIWLNIQGDEPFIAPEQIDALAAAFQGGNPPDIATLVKLIESEEEFLSESEAKVVIDSTGNALYFSRSPIPHFTTRPFVNPGFIYKHIGLYAFTSDALERIGQLPPSPLERAERLEQLRWLENGFRIRVAQTDVESRCVDTPEDLQALNEGLEHLFAEDAVYFS